VWIDGFFEKEEIVRREIGRKRLCYSFNFVGNGGER
jgi:hypothetical protein